MEDLDGYVLPIAILSRIGSFDTSCRLFVVSGAHEGKRETERRLNHCCFDVEQEIIESVWGTSMAMFTHSNSLTNRKYRQGGRLFVISRAREGKCEMAQH